MHKFMFSLRFGVVPPNANTVHSVIITNDCLYSTIDIVNKC